MSKRRDKKQEIADLVAAPEIRQTGAPRGRSFPKGHTIGAAHRFKPGNKIGRQFKKGQSGNPAGCPKGIARLAEAYQKILALVPGEFHPHTYAEAIALKIIEKARSGNIYAAQEIADRTEGKPRQAYDVALSVNDELAEIVEKARKRAARIAAKTLDVPAAEVEAA